MLSMEIVCIIITSIVIKYTKSISQPCDFRIKIAFWNHGKCNFVCLKFPLALCEDTLSNKGNFTATDIVSGEKPACVTRVAESSVLRGQSSILKGNLNTFPGELTSNILILLAVVS